MWTSSRRFQRPPRCPPRAGAIERATALSGFPERETARSEAAPPPGNPRQIILRGRHETRAPATAAPAPTPAAWKNEARPQSRNHLPGITAISASAQTPASASYNLQPDRQIVQTERNPPAAAGSSNYTASDRASIARPLLPRRSGGILPCPLVRSR